CESVYELLKTEEYGEVVQRAISFLLDCSPEHAKMAYETIFLTKGPTKAHAVLLSGLRLVCALFSMDLIQDRIPALEYLLNAASLILEGGDGVLLAEVAQSLLLIGSESHTAVSMALKCWTMLCKTATHESISLFCSQAIREILEQHPSCVNLGDIGNLISHYTNSVTSVIDSTILDNLYCGLNASLSGARVVDVVSTMGHVVETCDEQNASSAQPLEMFKSLCHTYPDTLTTIMQTLTPLIPRLLCGCSDVSHATALLVLEICRIEKGKHDRLVTRQQHTDEKIEESSSLLFSILNVLLTGLDQVTHVPTLRTILVSISVCVWCGIDPHKCTTSIVKRFIPLTLSEEKADNGAINLITQLLSRIERGYTGDSSPISPSDDAKTPLVEEEEEEAKDEKKATGIPHTSVMIGADGTYTDAVYTDSPLHSSHVQTLDVLLSSITSEDKESNSSGLASSIRMLCASVCNCLCTCVVGARERGTGSVDKTMNGTYTDAVYTDSPLHSSHVQTLDVLLSSITSEDKESNSSGLASSIRMLCASVCNCLCTCVVGARERGTGSVDKTMSVEEDQLASDVRTLVVLSLCQIISLLTTFSPFSPVTKLIKECVVCVCGGNDRWVLLKDCARAFVEDQAPDVDARSEEEEDEEDEERDSAEKATADEDEEDLSFLSFNTAPDSLLSFRLLGGGEKSTSTAAEKVTSEPISSVSSDASISLGTSVIASPSSFSFVSPLTIVKDEEDAHSMWDEGRVISLTGQSERIYAEASIHVRGFAVEIRVTLENRCGETLEDVSLELVCAGGKGRGADNNKPISLGPYGSASLVRVLRVGSFDAGPIVGFVSHLSSKRTVITHATSAIPLKATDFIEPIKTSATELEMIWSSCKWKAACSFEGLISTLAKRLGVHASASPTSIAFVKMLSSGLNMCVVNGQKTLREIGTGKLGLGCVNMVGKTVFGSYAIITVSLEVIERRIKANIKIWCHEQALASSIRKECNELLEE
ncbi:Coatomer beta subunit (COPB1) like protein, partial [Aduncisulcus paluster]